MARPGTASARGGWAGCPYMYGASKHFDRASSSVDSDTAMPRKGSGTEEREGRTPFDRPPLADG